MPQGVSGLFGGSAVISASSTTVSPPARWSQDSFDSPTSFDDALDRARGGTDASDTSGGASKADAAGKNAASPRKTAAGHASGKKKASPSRDAADAKAVKRSGKGPSSQSEQNATQDDAADDGAADPNSEDKPSRGDKPAKPADPVAAASMAPAAALVQVQEASAAKQTGGKVDHLAEAPLPRTGPNSANTVPAAPQRGATPENAKAKQVATNASTAASADEADSQQSPDALATDPSSDAATPLGDSGQQGASSLAIQPKNAKDAAGTEAPSPDAVAASASAAAAAALQSTGQVATADLHPADGAPGPRAVDATGTPPPRAGAKSADDSLLQAFGAAPQTVHSAALNATTAADPASDANSVSPTAQFAQTNHANIVSGIAGRLLPGGGSMQIRLDPPELGAMQVRVEMRDGVMTASFETSSDQATKLLSHSLGDLKTALEAQGVSVERLHVSQTRQQESSASGNNSGNGQRGESQSRQDAAQQEQQRREMMQRMWRRLMNGKDPLDLVA